MKSITQFRWSTTSQPGANRRLLGYTLDLTNCQPHSAKRCKSQRLGESGWTRAQTRVILRRTPRGWVGGERLVLWRQVYSLYIVQDVVSISERAGDVVLKDRLKITVDLCILTHCWKISSYLSTGNQWFYQCIGISFVKYGNDKIIQCPRLMLCYIFATNLFTVKAVTKPRESDDRFAFSFIS